MYYSVLARTGTNPFEPSDHTDPLGKLRVNAEATLIEFESQPTQLFSARYAPVYGFILWPATTINFHKDDYADRVEIGTLQEFQEFIDDLIRQDDPEGDALIEAWNEERKQLEIEGAGDASEAAWERVNNF